MEMPIKQSSVRTYMTCADIKYHIKTYSGTVRDLEMQHSMFQGLCDEGTIDDRPLQSILFDE